MNYFKGFKKDLSPDEGVFAIKQGVYGFVDRDAGAGWAGEMDIGNGEGGEIVGGNFDFKRLGLIFVGATLVLAGLIGRTAWLQVVKGDYYYSMAEGNRIRIERIEAKRGVIYDAKLHPLVRNVANFMLYVIPSDLPRDTQKRNSIFQRISDVIKVVKLEDMTGWYASVKPNSLESYQPFYIADSIPYEQAMLLMIESQSWSGVAVTNKTRREYTAYSQSIPHVLGYTGKISELELKQYGEEYLQIDYVGKTGIEYFWENQLRGANGKKQIEVDALGKEKKIISEQASEDGKNLVLTIDIEAQKKLEDILLSSLSKLKLTKASAVVMNPKNGELIALISLPSYDNNMFARGISGKEYKALLDREDRPLFNRAVSGEFPSGSTIKPIIVSAGLEERVVSENTTVLSTGGIRIGEWFFPDWKAGGHGSVNARSAIANSVNTYFYYIGGGYEEFSGLGIDRLVKYLKLFGLGSQTGIDLPGEASGFVPTKEWKEEKKKERWYIGDTYHLAIGQGDLLVTPLQVAMYTGYFASNGKIFRPHLVKALLSGNDQAIASIKEDPVREDLIESYNTKVVREGMRMTVTSGSARSMSGLPVAVAGKTGTAQWSTKEKPHAWFTGFAPYDDPNLVITVLIEEGEEGSSVAVPIAKDFIEWYYRGRFASSTPVTASTTPVR